MNIFKKFWNWLKNLLTKEYTKEQFKKDEIINWLDLKLPKKKSFSLKDVVKMLKDLIK